MVATSRVLEAWRPTPRSVLQLPVGKPFGGAERRARLRRTAAFLGYPTSGEEPRRGLDLSTHGMLCVASQPLWPGNLVVLDLQLPGVVESLRVRGVVEELLPHGRDFAMRIRFDTVSDKGALMICRWARNALAASG